MNKQRNLVNFPFKGHSLQLEDTWREVQSNKTFAKEGKTCTNWFSLSFPDLSVWGGISSHFRNKNCGWAGKPVLPLSYYTCLQVNILESSAWTSYSSFVSDAFTTKTSTIFRRLVNNSKYCLELFLHVRLYQVHILV